MPVGAGKTAFALDALLDTLHPQPFACAWVLLPNTRQQDAFHQLLVAHPTPEASISTLNSLASISYTNACWTWLVNRSGGLTPPRATVCYGTF